MVLDLVHERRAPLSPEATVEEFVGLLTPYRVRQVIGDRYSEELVRERFRAHRGVLAGRRGDRARVAPPGCRLIGAGSP